MGMDRDEAELIVVLDELLAVEPHGEEGECPWCGVLRAAWTGLARAHEDGCPWARLGPAFERLVADDA